MKRPLTIVDVLVLNGISLVIGLTIGFTVFFRKINSLERGDVETCITYEAPDLSEFNRATMAISRDGTIYMFEKLPEYGGE